MQKSMVEKLHNKLLKVIDTQCRGASYPRLAVTRLSDTEYKMTVVAEDMISAALFDACRPTKYSKMKIEYSNSTSKQITYEGKSGYYEMTAKMTIR